MSVVARVRAARGIDVSVTSRNKRDHWVCRDDMGLLHNSMVARFFDDEDKLCTLHVSTACHPKVEQFDGINQRGIYWHGSTLPAVTMTHSSPRFQIVEYHVREIPTCLQCLSVGSFG